MPHNPNKLALNFVRIATSKIPFHKIILIWVAFRAFYKKSKEERAQFRLLVEYYFERQKLRRLNRQVEIETKKVLGRTNWN